ncbi:PREDICTED: uncharacterized serine carboxypeptidase F41C3.5-like, partial [Rhagoletis zephyria]|uniref:uncharacterized serine carboxypeptidase F41C3.5-like n=1 Tax=Rhagoletis zephyria TaxID=28612 RepID=UPI000811A491
MQANGTLRRNQYSWNTNANLLFIDTPVNVGFSYSTSFNSANSTNSTNSTTTTTDDLRTAELNYAALQSFYRKFPHLLQNVLILAGQSYAGVYLPTLAMHILERNFPPHFRGISLGNPLLDHRYVVHSPLQLGHDHRLVNETVWRRLLKECNCGGGDDNNSQNSSDSTDAILSCPFLPLTWTSSSLPELEPPTCDALYHQIYLHLYKLAHNAYNYRQSCATREDTFICRTERDEAAFRWLNRADVQRALSVESPPME